MATILIIIFVVLILGIAFPAVILPLIGLFVIFCIVFAVKKANENKPKVNKLQSLSTDKLNQKITAYKKLPLILAITVLALFLTWAIVDCIVFTDTVLKSDYNYSGVGSNGNGWQSYEEKQYGVMNMSTAFGSIFLWLLIGGVIAVVTFFIALFATDVKIDKIETEIKRRANIPIEETDRKIK